MKKKILIAGAGISGFLTYLYLDRNKYDVTLIERGEDFRTVGYAIVMWNCGFAILRKTLLQNNPDYAKQFVALEKSLLVDEHTLPESLYSLRHLGCVVNREDLLGIFVTEARKLEGRMLTKTWIENIAQSHDSTTVTFNNGTTEEYDLIIVCEGINSPTRDRFFTGVSVVDSEYAVEYVETPRLPALSGKNIIFTIQNLTGVIMTSRKSTVLAHFLLKSEAGYLERREKLRSILKDLLVREYGPTAIPEYPTETQTFDLKDVHIRDFHVGTMVLLGDAAHGRVPVLGLGTTLATEDAYVLSNLLNRLTTEEIDTVLGEFSRKRQKRSEELYAIQDMVARASLPKKHPVPEQSYRPSTKVFLNVLNKIRNRIFTFIFARAVRYAIE